MAMDEEEGHCPADRERGDGPPLLPRAERDVPRRPDGALEPPESAVVPPPVLPRDFLPLLLGPRSMPSEEGAAALPPILPCAAAASSALLLLLLLVVVLHAFRVRSLRRLKSVPHTPGLPSVPDPHWFFGHLRIIHTPDFAAGQRRVYIDHADPAGRTSLWFVHKPAVSVLRAADVRAVLMASSYRRPPPFMLRHQRQFLGRGSMISLMGRKWRHYRQAAHGAFTPAAVGNMRSSIAEVGGTLVKSLSRAIADSPDGYLRAETLPIMKMVTVDVFGLAALGLDLGCCSELRLTPVAEAFDFLTEEFTRRIASPFDPTAHAYWVPTFRNIRHSRTRRFIRGFLEDIVVRKRKELKDKEEEVVSKRDRGCLLTNLIRANADAKDIFSDTDKDGKYPSNETLGDILMTLLFGGYDTTAITLSYVLHLLAENPNAERRCVREARAVLGWSGDDGDNDDNEDDGGVQSQPQSPSSSSSSTPPVAPDDGDLPYIRACVLEALRLFPPVPAVVRDLERDLRLPGVEAVGAEPVTVRQGSQVQIPIWSVHRDSRNFPRPDEFLPQRWVRKGPDGEWEHRPDQNKRTSTVFLSPRSGRRRSSGFSGRRGSSGFDGRRRSSSGLYSLTESASAAVDGLDDGSLSDDDGYASDGSFSDDECDDVPPADRSAFCTFSGGGRDCIGKKFALQESVAMLAYLLRDFKFESEPGYVLRSVAASVVQRPEGGLPMRIRLREGAEGAAA